MKRIFSVLLVAIMIITLTITVLATGEGPAFSVRVVSTAETVNSRPALTVDWRIKANEPGLQLRGGSGLRLTYDNTVLQLMRYNGTGADYNLTTTLSTMVSAAAPISIYEGVYPTVRACQSTDTTIGYVTIEIGDPELTYDCIQGIEETLTSIRFAFRDGKTQADLKNDSIRLMTIEDLESKVQPAALNISVASGGVNVVHVYRSRTAPDSLDAPEIVLPLIQKPDLTEIVVSTPPTKTVYFVGETLDLADMIITAT
ncbi:MAG: hypothetical protein FWD21_02210, partial [Peptococcaceae bacterium]|nr:hypothetical protein [Peptococcaceae bacterium]